MPSALALDLQPPGSQKLEFRTHSSLRDEFCFAKKKRPNMPGFVHAERNGDYREVPARGKGGRGIVREAGRTRRCRGTPKDLRSKVGDSVFPRRMIGAGDSMAKEGRLVSIRIAGNTMIPCLQAIAAKGYSVTHYFQGNKRGEWDRPQWDAEKDGKFFSATGLEELLGLIAMWEVRGDDWRAKLGEAELHDRLVEEAPMYDADGHVIDR